MKRALSLFVIYYLLAFSSLAQINIDSLRQVLLAQENDSNKVKTYLQFFYTDLYYSNPDEVIQLTKKAIELSKKIEFEKGEADAYNTLGYMHRIRSENDSALYYFKKGAETAEVIKYVNGIADARTGLGNTYNQLGDWQKAIPHFEYVVQIAQKANNNILVASANNNIGNIYLSKGAYVKALGHYQKSIEKGNSAIKEVALVNIGLVHNQLLNFQKARSYFTEAIELFEQSGNKYSLAFVYQQLGTLEHQQGEYQFAIDYFSKATNAFAAINERYNISEIKTNLANVYFDLNDYEKALNEYRESLTLQKEIGHYVGICNNLTGIGQVLLAAKNYQAAEDTLLLADLMADTLELLPTKNKLAGSLSTLYKENDDFLKALEYYQLHKILSDSLTNLQKSELVAEMEAKYEISKKEQEIELLNTEKQLATLQLQKQQNLRNFLMILAISLMLLIAVGYSRYQIKIKAHQKLQELDQIKTNFFTNISHEFRTPLTLILNPLTDLLKSTESQAIKPDLELIHRNADRLLELTNQLLDLSKLEAGKLQLSVGNYNLQEFLQIIAASFESLARSRNISFKTEIDKSLENSYFDQDKLQKILNNLLSNAFKFTPEGGSISLIANLKDTSNVVIKVKDTGAGIPLENQQQIFERFYQNQKYEDYGGTGIGLTLTKELVQLHHGNISVESSLGEGSIFTVKIPTEAAAYSKNEIGDLINSSQKSLPITSSTPAIEHLLEKEDVPITLVIEDNLDLRNHIASVLFEKYKVVLATNGIEGLERAIELVPDIVISDWMMPEMDGVSFSQKLKTNESTSHIPIIMLTAKADINSKLDGLKTGVDEYLTKPFNTEELLVRMDNLIKQREHLRIKFGKTISIAPSKINLSDPNEAFIQKVLAIVEEHISDSDFTVEEMQKEIGMSRTQLHRKLKALTNFSASEFIRNLRLQRAADLLAANGFQVTEVAYQSGFNSMSYFTQCFKEKYGVTPSKYIKKEA